jgi:putative hemolysin
MFLDLLIFGFFLAIYAFFSAAETAFIAVSPYTLESLARQGSQRARLILGVLARINDFLATILVGNTLVGVAAASLATSLATRLLRDPDQAVLLATVSTTVLILVFSELNPKTFAAHYPLKTSLLFVYPVRVLLVLFYPLVKAFSFLTGLLMPSTKSGAGGLARHLNEEEIRILLSSGPRSVSSLRKKMIAGVLDIGARPVKEVMVPRPQVKAIEAGATLDEVMAVINAAGYSRYPVFRGRMDNIEGVLHAKDIICHLADNKSFDISSGLRPAFFVPELASLETTLVQMQQRAAHLALVVDEFGSFEGIVTLEDIIEEIVGDIRDEHDDQLEEAWFSRLEEGQYLVKGSMPVKEANQALGLRLPERSGYTTLAGFFLSEFGRIPQDKDSLVVGGVRYSVERMNKRHISLLRVDLRGREAGPAA